MSLPTLSSSNQSVLDDSSFPLFDWLAQTINGSRAVSINGDLLWNSYKSEDTKSFIEKVREKSLRSAITNNPRDMLSELKDSTLIIYRESDAWSVSVNVDLSVVISKSSILPQVDSPAPVVDAPVVDAPAPVVDAPVVDAPAPVVDAPVVDAPAPVVDAPVVDAPAPVVDAPVVDAPAPVVDAPVVDAPAPVVDAPAPVVDAPVVDA